MTKKSGRPRLLTRPIVQDYGAAHEFLQQLLLHYKDTDRFSVRQRALKVKNCSPALVSQVLAGKRRLTRDQLPAFAHIFKLSSFEFNFLDQGMREELAQKKIRPGQDIGQDISKEDRPKRRPQNNILSSWFHSYVKDLVHMKGFTPESKTLYGMLGGLVHIKKVEQSINFLLREGFWRKTPERTIVPEDPALISTSEIASENIRNFHKHALKIALRGLERFSIQRRKSSTILISIDREKIPELRSLLDDFQNQLLKFIEDNPRGSDELVQVTIHLTPVGEGEGDENR